MLISFLTFAAAAAAVSQPVPVNVSGWIRASDIPWTMRLRQRDNLLRYELNVDERGEPADCAITRSSGSPTFDEKTCRLLIERAKFEPARDEEGRPRAATYSGSVNWQVLDPGKLRVADFGPWLTRVTLQVAPSGMIDSCQREVEGRPGWGAAHDACELFTGPASYPVAQLAENHGTLVLISGIRRPEDAEPSVPGAALLARRSAELAFRADGRLIRCTLLPSHGEFELQESCDRYPAPVRRKGEAAEHRIGYRLIFGVPR